jgi:hypothetical protein
MTQLYKASGLFATKPLKVCHSAIKQCSKCTTAEVASPDHHKISIMKDMLRFAVLWTVTTSELHSIGNLGSATLQQANSDWLVPRKTWCLLRQQMDRMPVRSKPTKGLSCGAPLW